MNTIKDKNKLPFIFIKNLNPMNVIIPTTKETIKLPMI